MGEQMNPRKRIFLLIAIMSSIVVIVELISFGVLYHTAVEEEKARLVDSAKSQARLIEAVARFDRRYSGDYPYGTRQATIDQIKDAHKNYPGFGRTGEFTLSTREKDRIVFILSHRHKDIDNPRPVQWKTRLAEPMRLALSGRSGTIIGLDYRGETVLAAYEPVGELNLGIVAKIDLSEIRAPFVRAGLISALIAVIIILTGTVIFIKVTNPVIRRLQDTVSLLEQALGEVKTLKGILPICSFCKKIRNDAGYWEQVDHYIHEHTDADFSHGICPDCMARHYPDFRKKDSKE